jgi:hypothetical protein
MSRRRHGDLVGGRDGLKCPRLGAWGSGKVGGMFEIGGPEERSLRRRGQVLVVVGALLGAVSGIVLGLAVDDSQTPTAVVAPGQAGAAALAAQPPSSQPAASESTGSRERADGDASTGRQRTEPADRLSNGHGNAGKDSEGRQGKPSKDKPGKGKDK